ncbi:MAG: hypothetical protein SO434_05600 [Eubacteriales bacterium]|nr:hypothetical protein [Eubacteriales bacterium]
MKLWIRLLEDNKMIKDKIVQCNNIGCALDLEEVLRDICHSLDLPTPIVLPTHYRNFVNFHNAKFKKDDFVESLDGDILIVEDCKE